MRNMHSAGRDSRGRFKEGSDAARRAGRKGGKQAQANRTAHKLTKVDQSRGGTNSHISSRVE